MSIVIAVYWTLKKWLGNYGTMERAKWKFIWSDHIQVKYLKDVWFPCIKLSNKSNKWLVVELFEVEEDNIHVLDSLEWYEEWRAHNHYNRVIISTLSNKEVSVYEYNDEITKAEDNLEAHFKATPEVPRFYSWDK